MTDYEIYSLQSYTDGIEEDLRPIKRAEFEELNQEKIGQYMEKIKKKKPNISKFSDEKILKLNGIIKNSTDEIHPRFKKCETNSRKKHKKFHIFENLWYNIDVKQN